MPELETLSAEVQQAEGQAAAPASTEEAPAAVPTLEELQAKLDSQAAEAEKLRRELSGRSRENEKLKQQLRGIDLAPIHDTLAKLERGQAALAKVLLVEDGEETAPPSKLQRFQQELAGSQPQPQAQPAVPATPKVPVHIQTVIDDLVDITTEAGLDVGNLPAELKDAQEDSRALLWSGRPDRAKAIWQKAVNDYAAVQKASQQQATQRNKAAAGMVQAKVKPEGASQLSDDDFLAQYAAGDLNSTADHKRARQLLDRYKQGG